VRKRGSRRVGSPEETTFARRATMVDVASEAQVSQTSVSLVLNFAEGARLSPQTRQRVINAARKLGYQPVRRGKMASGTSTIAFFCDEISTDPWAAVALNGVSEKAWEYGLSVTATVTHGDPEIEAAAFAQLAARPHAGLIYATINTRLIRANPAFFNQPTILLNCHCAKSLFSSVVPDEAEGGYAATDVLIRAGHKRIGYIGGEVGMEASRLRLRGYKRALAAANLPFDPDLLHHGDWQPPSGYLGARALVALPAPPTAIFSANDMMAVGCYDALRELGLRIPQDVAVMGYDDREIAQHMHPPLSTVVLPHYAMGTTATELLFELVEHSTIRPRHVKVNCPVVSRQSV
jgi:LacI family transcriptional regulator